MTKDVFYHDSLKTEDVASTINFSFLFKVSFCGAVTGTSDHLLYRPLLHTPTFITASYNPWPIHQEGEKVAPQPHSSAFVRKNVRGYAAIMTGEVGEVGEWGKRGGGWAERGKGGLGKGGVGEVIHVSAT